MSSNSSCSNNSNYDPFSTPDSTSKWSRRNSNSYSNKISSNTSKSSKSRNKLKEVRVKRVRKYTSCENCIEKKIKCDRSMFCSSCAMRGLNCSWGRGKPNLPVSERDALRAAKIEIEQLQSKVALLESQLIAKEEEKLIHYNAQTHVEIQEVIPGSDIYEEESEGDVKPQISLSPSPVLDGFFVTYPEAPYQNQSKFGAETYSPHSPTSPSISNPINHAVGRPQFFHRPHSFIGGLSSPPMTPQYQNFSDFSDYNSQPEFVALPNLEKSNSNSFDDYSKQNFLIHQNQVLRPPFDLEQVQHSNQVYHQKLSPAINNESNPYPTPPAPQSRFNFSAPEIDNRFNCGNLEGNFNTSGFISYPIHNIHHQLQQPRSYLEPKPLQFPPFQSTHHQIESYPYSNERGSIEDRRTFNEGLGTNLRVEEKLGSGQVAPPINLFGRSFFKPNYTFGFQVEPVANYIDSVVPGELESIEE